MSEAMKLLAECMVKVGEVEDDLALEKEKSKDRKEVIEQITSELFDWKNEAEGHRKANETLQRRVEELEEACADLNEEVNDMNRIRGLMNQAGIEGPQDIAVGTELSSRVREVIEENEERGKREFDLMRFLNAHAACEMKHASDAISEAIRMLKAAWHPRDGQ